MVSRLSSSLLKIGSLYINKLVATTLCKLFYYLSPVTNSRSLKNYTPVLFSLTYAPELHICARTDGRSVLSSDTPGDPIGPCVIYI